MLTYSAPSLFQVIERDAPRGLFGYPQRIDSTTTRVLSTRSSRISCDALMPLISALFDLVYALQLLPIQSCDLQHKLMKSAPTLCS